VRQSPEGEILEQARINNDPVALACAIEKAGRDPEVVLEAIYGWYWAVDCLQACGARVHLTHPLGVKGFAYRRVKNDVRDASDLADLLRMGRLPEAWIGPPDVRELRELVRYRDLFQYWHNPLYAEDRIMPRDRWESRPDQELCSGLS
jgi:transposase